LGCGKTTTTRPLCRALRDHWPIGSINQRHLPPKEDAESAHCGCQVPCRKTDHRCRNRRPAPQYCHFAKNASIKSAAIARMRDRLSIWTGVLIESGGDNLSVDLSVQLAV